MASAVKRRKLDPATPEIVFDDSARAEFLTGFHKRKQARIKHAQDVAAKKERRDKLQDRAAMRRQRREQVEAHVAAITAALREANDLGDAGEAQEFEEWQGIEEVDHEEEYVDEDKFTTVTVESVGISRDGFTRPGDESESEAEEAGKGRGRREPAKAKPAKKRSAAKSKKRNFRYESKAERSMTRFKEKRKLLRRKLANQERKR